jgi:hypothetical protein
MSDSTDLVVPVETPAVHSPDTLQGMLHALIARVEGLEAKLFGKDGPAPPPVVSDNPVADDQQSG